MVRCLMCGGLWLWCVCEMPDARRHLTFLSPVSVTAAVSVGVSEKTMMHLSLYDQVFPGTKMSPIRFADARSIISFCIHS